MALDGRVSNALGVPLPAWIIKQLNKRSKVSLAETPSNDNVLFRGNRTAWVRLVSSVDIINENNKKYFIDLLGEDAISNEQSLAKLFVLQGGVSKYGENSEVKNGFSYLQRSGFQEAYNVAGKSEVENFGYRPMPGMTSVKIQTQGKLGSIRSAEVQIKVWDKAQLDIIDALYFKLGYTMLLEWGHTFFYRAESNELESAENYSIDPFPKDKKLTKEDIQNLISNNVRKSEGNYDAMLGMVTNFNFTYNQEGGYDCTLKLISLGVLISNTKMNNPRILPDVRDDVIKRLVDTLIKIEKARILREWEKENPPVSAATTITTTTQKPKTFDQFFQEKVTQNKQNLRDYLYLPTQVGKDAKISEVSKADVLYDPEGIWGIKKFGAIIYGVNAEESIESITLDSNSIRNNLPFTFLDSKKRKEYTIQNADDFAKLPSFLEDQVPDTTDSLDFYLRAATGRNFDVFGLNYTRKDNQEVFTGGKLSNQLLQRNYKLYIFINRGALRGTKGLLGWDKEPTDFEQAEIKKAVFNHIIGQDTTISQSGGKINLSFEKVILPRPSGNNSTGPTMETVNVKPYTNRINTPEFTRYRPNMFVYNNVTADIRLSPETSKASGGATIRKSVIEYVVCLTDSGIIKDLKLVQGVAVNTVEQSKINADRAAAAAAASAPPPPPPPPQPTLNVSTIQKSESVKYQSAFEVMVRTIQLYSLDSAIKNNIETESGRSVKVLNLLDPKVYSEFTKPLFSVGLFAPILDDLININQESLKFACALYDAEIEKTGTIANRDNMLFIRACFGFHYGLMGNKVEDSKNLATDLLSNGLYVDYKALFTSYVVPYSFNTGIFEGTQLNHPTYIPLGTVLMILNHICAIYDSDGVTKVDRPMFYIDFNNKTNICLSNAKHLSTNPYDVLIPFQGDNDDFRSIIEPSVTGYDKNNVWYIKPADKNGTPTPIYRPRDDNDFLSSAILPFKIDGDSKVEKYRGRTMNILLSCDYLLKVVSTYTKQNGSGDIYVREFVEQVLFDINKALGDINVFRLAYDDGANTAYVTDDQMTPNLENKFSDSSNITQLPIFGKRSIARSIEIRTEVSSKLANMIAISANSNSDEQSNLSKSTDSYGFYNLGYKDRYIPRRTEFTSSVVLPTEPMINSAIQFNKAIETFYSEPTPADVSHATNYYIERMSKLKTQEKATRASALIPVSLNFTMDGMAGLGMGYSFTIPNEFLPYTYDLSQTNPFGEPDHINTVGFVMTGLDQTIENNQWLSSVRSNMLYLKKRSDFDVGSEYQALKKSNRAFKGVPPEEKIDTGGGKNNKDCPPCEGRAQQYKKDPACSGRQPGVVVPSYTFDAVKNVTYKEDNSNSSPNKNAGGMKKIVGIVIHHSAGNLSTDIAIMKSAGGENPVSYHTLIGADGTRYNFVSESDRAWHAGCSYIEHPNIPGGFTCDDVNSYFLGLSFEGAPNFVGKGGTRSINVQEIDSAAKWIVDKIKKYGMPKDLSTIVTHGVVACGRKDDVVRSVETAIKNRIRQLL